jgi:hypothetical protein
LFFLDRRSHVGRARNELCARGLKRMRSAVEPDVKKR